MLLLQSRGWIVREVGFLRAGCWCLCWSGGGRRDSHAVLCCARVIIICVCVIVVSLCVRLLACAFPVAWLAPIESRKKKQKSELERERMQKGGWMEGEGLFVWDVEMQQCVWDAVDGSGAESVCFC